MKKLKIKVTLLYNIVSLGSLGTELPVCFMGGMIGERKQKERGMRKEARGRENGKNRNGKIMNRKRGAGEITLL